MCLARRRPFTTGESPSGKTKMEEKRKSPNQMAVVAPFDEKKGGEEMYKFSEAVSGARKRKTFPPEERTG